MIFYKCKSLIIYLRHIFIFEDILPHIKRKEITASKIWKSWTSCLLLYVLVLNDLSVNFGWTLFSALFVFTLLLLLASASCLFSHYSRLHVAPKRTIAYRTARASPEQRLRSDESEPLPDVTCRREEGGCQPKTGLTIRKPEQRRQTHWVTCRLHLRHVASCSACPSLCLGE